jgi:peroxiredoxin
MPRPPSTEQSQPEISLELAGGGWHCSHLYYSFDRGELSEFGESELAEARSELVEILAPNGTEAPVRVQTSIVSGGEADFALMVMDADPLKVDSVHQRLMASRLGPAIVPSYSFVSVTEISEYVPSIEQYGERLVAEGEEQGSPTWAAKVKAYEGRLGAMNKQRLTPDFPQWPATCFYPMNKKREVGENWFMLDKDARNKLMSEHARSGMQFAGKVSQLITVALGYDDWEWGVTLWARNPEFLKDIVYKMRFDEASARYAEFGPFYISYVSTAEEMLAHCRI